MNKCLASLLGVFLVMLSSVALSACSLMDSARDKPIVVRVADEEDERQKEIDELRKEIKDSTKYGGGETKDWNDRYLDHNPNDADSYQGPTSGTIR